MIHRRTAAVDFKRFGWGLILVFGTPLSVVAQDAAVERQSLRGSVHVLYGPGGNIAASIGDDGVLLVDDQVAAVTEQIRTALADVTDDDVAWILNTHWHHDHTGGNEAFGAEAPIVAHHNVRKRLSEPQAILGMTFDALSPTGLPVVTFADSLSIHFNGEEVRVIHVPRGHTDGDAVVWFTGSNVYHMGDLYFNSMFPFVDLKTGGDVENLIAVIDAWLARIPPEAAVIPGHGSAGDIDALARYHTMLVETVATVRAHIDAGLTLPEITAAEKLEAYADWGRGFISTEHWITIVYGSLTAGD